MKRAGYELKFVLRKYTREVKVKDKTTDEKVDFLYPFVPYLRGILNISTAVDDNNEMYRFCSNQTIAYLMVYRYEHKISILEDLHFELSVKDVDIYDSALSKKLAQEEVDASLEFQRNHPEEYRRKNEERREFLNKMAERIKNNLLKYELSKKDNK